MTENDDVRLDGDGGVPNVLNQVRTFIQTFTRILGPGSDGTARGEGHMGPDDVSASLRHSTSLIGGEDIGGGEHPHLVGKPYHISFDLVRHARLLQPLAELTIDEAD